jgi:hypothetical protein
MKALGILAILVLAACKSQPQPQPQAQPQPEPKKQEEPKVRKEADRITVQHILIGYQGSVPGKPITRSKEEAEKLAQSLLERARKGEDFAKMTREFSDDSPEGIYSMSNLGIQPKHGEEFPRNRMVKGFGDAAFALEVGQVGIATYDPQASPYGWHIIKRLK